MFRKIHIFLITCVLQKRESGERYGKVGMNTLWRNRHVYVMALTEHLWATMKFSSSGLMLIVCFGLIQPITIEACMASIFFSYLVTICEGLYTGRNLTMQYQLLIWNVL